MIVVEDSAAATGMAASAFHDHPSRKLRLTGVTGTNGKTTIATLLYNLFDALGYKCGLLSTVCNYVFRTRRDATHTTPDPVKLNALLAELVDQGCEYAFMEVSSHAVDQERIAGLDLRVPDRPRRLRRQHPHPRREILGRLRRRAVARPPLPAMKVV